MNEIGERSKAIMAVAGAFCLAVLIGFGGSTAAASIDEREHASTESPGEIWEWDHEQDRWERRPQILPNASRFNPEIDQSSLD